MSLDNDAVQSATAGLPDEHLQSAPAGSALKAPPAAPAPAGTAAQPAAPAPAANPPAGDPNQPPDPDAQPPEPQAKKPGIQKRIDELTRERYEAERRAAAAEQQLRALNQRQQQQPPAQDKPPPKITDFQDIDSFLAARDAWQEERVLGKLRAEQQQASQRQQQENQQHGHQVAQLQAVERFKGAEAEARERYTDYDTVVSTPQMQQLRTVRPDLAQAVIDSPHGADVVYYLGKNPQVAQQLATLNTFAAAREIGRIEQMFMQPKPQATNAPPPPKQVGGRADAGKNPENMNMREYREFRSKGGGRSS